MDSPRTPPPPTDAPAVAPVSLPAINHAGGIARLMGDGALFARVLARFRNEYRQATSGIRAALEHGDMPLALRLVHTLKGAAGMIEAVPLRREAHALEQVLRSGDGNADAALGRLQDELERVLRELDVLAGSLAERPAGSPPPAKPVAPATVTAAAPADGAGVVQRLVMLLDEGNGDAVDLVRDAAPALAAQLGDNAYRSVAEAVEAFDFDGALDLLRAHATGS